MSAATIEAPPELTRAEVRDRITAAAAARDEGMALAELGDTERGGFAKALIDQAIEWFAQTHRPFSANDFRDLLPADLPVRGLMGSRFYAAQKRGLIYAVGGETSTKKNTHHKGIARWRGVREERADDYSDDVPLFDEETIR